MLHVSALVEVHESVAGVPRGVDIGETATLVTVAGTLLTVTVAGNDEFPPGPVQERVYVAVWLGLKGCTPFCALTAPMPLSIKQEVASRHPQTNRVDCPWSTTSGLITKAQVGAGFALTFTVIGNDAVPPGPTAVRLYVVVLVGLTPNCCHALVPPLTKLGLLVVLPLMLVTGTEPIPLSIVAESVLLHPQTRTDVWPWLIVSGFGLTAQSGAGMACGHPDSGGA